MDFKEQAFKDDTNAIDDWDQRKTTGQFRGAEEGLHVKTLAEFRAECDIADLLTNPDRVEEFVKPGDNLVMIFNRLQAMLNLKGEVLGPIANALPWKKVGLFVYDND
jgi:hypothetical protein